MNNAVFDPELLTAHAGRFEARVKGIVGWDSRYLFYRLNQSVNDEEVVLQAYYFIKQSLNKVSQKYAGVLSNDDSIENLVSLSPAALPKQYDTPENRRNCIRQTAAIHLTQPVWLQNVSQVCGSQSTTAVHIMSIFLQLTEKNSTGFKLNDLHQVHLLSHGVDIPKLHAYEYSQQTDINTTVFDFSTAQLALSRFPRLFLPEILGFTLSFCQLSSLTEICFPEDLLLPLFFKQRQQILKQSLVPLQQCMTEYLSCFPQQKPVLWKRIQQGFCLYQLQSQQCRDQLEKDFSLKLSSQQAVTNLLQHKVQAAMGHHQKVMLQGISLEQWFSGMPENHHAFLEALKQSDYVNASHPLESPLLRLFGFEGPMVGVLNKTELEVIQRWLLSDSNEINIKVVVENKSAVATSVIKDKVPNKYAQLSYRQLYYYLLNADLFPDVLPVAKVKARHLLKLSQWASSLPFKHYSHQQFDVFIACIYQAEMRAYQPLKGKPKISKSAYIWGIEQIAPMILIDGCWLQNSLSLQQISPEVSQLLFAIYGDEVGNGCLQNNHPYIFQQLLDSLSIQLPEATTQAFIKHSIFMGSAFDLPSYMLALSCHSTIFLPELLGLNMAIELSGLGKGYLQLVDEWRYYGIDTRIANRHISIDNYASGHTFMAKKAIHLYMDDILKQTADRAVVDQHWARIYAGYASLRWVGQRFKLSLPLGYLHYKWFANQ